MSLLDIKARLKISNLEQNRKQLETVVAQFNPKEIQIDSASPWQLKPHKAGPYDLEYTGGQPDSMAFELFFDGFEENRSVVPQIEALKQMTLPMQAKGEYARPPIVSVIWGAGIESYNLPKFRGVIESVSVKYTMFSREGQVVRATASVKLKQVREASVGKSRA